MHNSIGAMPTAPHHRTLGHSGEIEVDRRLAATVPKTHARTDVGHTPTPEPIKVVYATGQGFMVQGLAEDALRSALLDDLRGNLQLVFTSPPFPLNRKKKYGNLRGTDYVDWLAGFAPVLAQFLSHDGSIVMELGNAWEPGQPVMSTLALESLLAFLKKGNLRLCQQFIGYNRARLPSPAQWVNVER